MKRLTRIILVLSLLIPASTRAQLFGHYTTAAISSEGEGGVFATAGDDRFQTGVAARFLLMDRSDLGLQLGFDRNCGISSFGAGIDLKFYLLSRTSGLPVDLALDGYYGHLRSSRYRRNLFGVGLIVSGVIQSSIKAGVEPYASVTLLKTYYDREVTGRGKAACFWPGDVDRDGNDTKTVFAGGVKIPLTDEHQLFVELSINGDIVFGAAMNVIF